MGLQRRIHYSMAHAVIELKTEDALKEQFVHMVNAQGIFPFFQPIVDLYTGAVFGYEVLSRGTDPFRMPQELFGYAELWGLSWDLEYACRAAALRKISSLPKEAKAKRFFLNVSPSIFHDPRFQAGFTLGYLRDVGLDSENVVLEITETASVDDYEQFEELVRHYVEQGFRVALDDFGAGHSGLTTLAAMAPHYLKIDKALVCNIHKSPYKQHLIKAIVSFAVNVESNVIAEGIETKEELDALFRLGIRYAQGFLFERPAPEPEPLKDEVSALIQSRIRKFHFIRTPMDISISDLVHSPLVFECCSTKCETLDKLFRKDPCLDHVVLLWPDGRPKALLTRQHFYSVVSGMFGYSVFQNRYIDEVAKEKTLMVQESTDIRSLSKEAMNRSRDDLYDPVIVVDTDGGLVGTVTLKEILGKAIDLEVRIAAGSNPLTQLPGNILISLWLQEALQNPPFSVVYADLDHFKEYNDVYGFTKGDEMIKLVAKVLSHHCPDLGSTTRLGHIGGDDFLIVAKEQIDEEVLNRICRDFDDLKRGLFHEESLKRGGYHTVNRKGERVKVPLVTMSMAVIMDTNFASIPQLPKLGEIAAMLKKKVKTVTAETGKSEYIMDKRKHRPEHR